jgi:hypothetical protein
VSDFVDVSRLRNPKTGLLHTKGVSINSSTLTSSIVGTWEVRWLSSHCWNMPVGLGLVIAFLLKNLRPKTESLHIHTKDELHYDKLNLTIILRGTLLCNGA